MSNLSTISNFGLLPTYRVFDEFDSLFDSFLGDRRSGSRSQVSTPRVNVEETAGGYDVHMAAPGLSREDFKIQADGGYITISVNRKEENDEKSNFLTREYSYSSFARSWKLPTSTNVDGITARYNAGVLTVSVPTASKKSSKVEIRVD
jgi:HSP20 family protein